MSSRRALAIICAVVALSIGASAPAQAKVFHTPVFHAFHQRVGCGAQLASLGGMSCFSAALPSTELDGYIELHANGDSKLGERGDSPWRSGKDTKLRKHQRWSRAGVTCKLLAVLRCTNLDGRGFTLTPAAYAVF
jgi:hypothetical protein